MTDLFKLRDALLMVLKNKYTSATVAQAVQSELWRVNDAIRIMEDSDNVPALARG